MWLFTLMISWMYGVTFRVRFTWLIRCKVRLEMSQDDALWGTRLIELWKFYNLCFFFLFNFHPDRLSLLLIKAKFWSCPYTTNMLQAHLFQMFRCNICDKSSFECFPESNLWGNQVKSKWFGKISVKSHTSLCTQGLYKRRQWIAKQ